MNRMVGLGHCRLSIVDLSPNGRQPMASHDERYLLAFNGEIYNHLDLKNELQETGYSISWRGRSDTEVVLAAIVAWGLEAALEKFIGMFSLRFGIKKIKKCFLSEIGLGKSLSIMVV